MSWWEGKKVILGDTDIAGGWISIDRSPGATFNMHLDKNTKFDMFDDNSIDCIYTSHMIEHMTIEDVENIVIESYRVLNEGGILRVVAPDALKFINEYLKSPDDFGTYEEYAVGTGRTYKDEIMWWADRLNLSEECLKPHNLLCSEFVCYCDDPQYGHTFDKDIFEKKIKEGTDEFLEWVTSHYNTSRPAGHMTAFYADKVIKLMKKCGFNKTYNMKFRESHFEEITWNEAIDLELRKNISFYAEGIK